MDSKRSFRLARFKDKNIQWSCIDEIKQIITGICVHKFRREGKDWTNETAIKIPIDPIINRIKATYGYFLPFNIMKGKIGLKVQEFGYMPDENRRYKEQILIKVSDYFNCNRLR